MLLEGHIETTGFQEISRLLVTFGLDTCNCTERTVCHEMLTHFKNRVQVYGKRSLPTRPTVSNVTNWKVTSTPI